MGKDWNNTTLNDIRDDELLMIHNVIVSRKSRTQKIDPSPREGMHRNIATSCALMGNMVNMQELCIGEGDLTFHNFVDAGHLGTIKGKAISGPMYKNTSLEKTKRET